MKYNIFKKILKNESKMSKKISTLILSLILICGLVTAQDTLFIYKGGMVVTKQALTNIDSVTFYKGATLNDLPFSSNTPTQVKTDLENTGISLVDKMKDLNKTSGMQATVNLINLMANSSSSSSTAKSAAFTKLKAVASVGNGSRIQSIVGSLGQMSDEIGIAQIYDSIAGIYTYNFKTGDFDKTTSTTFSVNFPATLADKNSKTNTGVFEIAKPIIQEGPYTFGNITISDLPTNIQFDIKVDGNSVLNYSFTGAYNSDGLPVSVSGALTIGTFVFSSDWSYSTSDIKLNSSISDSSKSFVNMGWEMTGSFDKTSIKNIANSDNPDPTLILTNSNANFQFFNLKIAGQIDFKDFYNGMNNIGNNYSSDSARNSAEIAVIKDNMALVLVYADNNKVAAKVEPYLKPYQYTNWVYNPKTGMYETQPATGYDVNIRLVFSDKSKSDLGTYFQSGFDGLTNEFNSLIDDLNKTYGWSINHTSKK